MRISLKTLLISVLLLLALSASVLVYQAFSRDPEKEAVAALVEEIVSGVGKNRAQDYLNFVDLDAFGLRLEYWGQIYAFGKGEHEKFLLKAEEWVPLLTGSEARTIKLKIEMNPPTAEATLTAHWKKGPARGFGIESALVGCRFRLARAESGWKVSGAEIFPARDFMLNR